LSSSCALRCPAVEASLGSGRVGNRDSSVVVDDRSVPAGVKALWPLRGGLRPAGTPPVSSRLAGSGGIPRLAVSVGCCRKSSPGTSPPGRCCSNSSPNAAGSHLSSYCVHVRCTVLSGPSHRTRPCGLPTDETTVPSSSHGPTQVRLRRVSLPRSRGRRGAGAHSQAEGLRAESPAEPLRSEGAGEIDAQPIAEPVVK
jgi:hypothetical protein